MFVSRSVCGPCEVTSPVLALRPARSIDVIGIKRDLMRLQDRPGVGSSVLRVFWGCGCFGDWWQIWGSTHGLAGLVNKLEDDCNSNLELGCGFHKI